MDARIEATGGAVFRSTMQHFEEEQRGKGTAAVRAELDNLKAGLAQARADRKGKIQATAASQRRGQLKYVHPGLLARISAPMLRSLIPGRDNND